MAALTNEICIFLRVEEILPPEMFQALSHPARRIYGRVWNLMRKKDRSDLWISDRALITCGHIDPLELAGAKAELERMGLFKIRRGKNPTVDPRDVCHQYKFVVQD